MAGGAYFNAKKGSNEFASKHFCRSEGVVSSIVGGPSSPEEHTHTSSRPQEFNTSSISASVDCSSDVCRGYGMTLLFGCNEAKDVARLSDAGSEVGVHAYMQAAP